MSATEQLVSWPIMGSLRFCRIPLNREWLNQEQGTFRSTSRSRICSCMAHAPCTALDAQPMRSYRAVRIEQPHLFDTIALYIVKPAMRARGR
jgi:hypothetical protein